MARPEKPITSTGAVAELALALRELRVGAGLRPYRALAADCGRSATVLSQAASGDQVPQWPVVEAFVRACGSEPDQRWRGLYDRAARAGAGNAAVLTFDPTLISASSTAMKRQEGTEALVGPADLTLRLKLIRVRAGNPTLQAMSQTSGVARSTLGDVFQGKAMPRYEVLLALMESFHVSGQERSELIEAWNRAVLQHGRFTPAASPSPKVQAGLPVGPERLVGRERQLSQLLNLLKARHDPANPASATVAAVGGPPGVGKTALVLQAAHHAAAAGWFPGGALYLNLHGYDPAQHWDAAHALQTALRALGIRDTELPPSFDEQVGLYRSLLGEKQEPVLIVLDDAARSEQVLPLLPGRSVHKVLVTSRHTLATLPARVIDLGVLDRASAVELLSSTMLMRNPADPRPENEREELGLVAARCGDLPLAVQIVAARLVTEPLQTVARLAEDLADLETRLNVLEYGDGGRPIAVRSAFELSYRRLNPEQARLFRLLSLTVGPDIGSDAAGALAGLPQVRIRPLLTALVQAHLVESAGPDRWRIHDLVRAYMSELSTDPEAPDERESALDRLMAFYRRIATDAVDFLNEPRRHSTPTRTLHTDRAEALAWLDREGFDVMAAVQVAQATGRVSDVIVLSSAIGEYLLRRGQATDAIAMARLGQEAARRSGDRAAQAQAHERLGNALRRLVRLTEATAELERAAKIFQELSDRHGEGRVLDTFGCVLRETGEFDQAVGAHRRAVGVFLELADRHRAAAAWENVCSALCEMGELDQAISAHREATAIFRDLGDRYREAEALDGLGCALRDLGDLDKAVDAHERAIAVFREFGDRYREAGALDNLGNALRQASRVEESIDAHQRATEIYQPLGAGRGPSVIFEALGEFR